jgi:transcriptional regulator with PAS, ATPase and Fis domain
VPLAETDAIGTSSRTPLALRLNKVRAEVVQGPDRGASVEIGARRVVIGRAPDCDLTLSDTTVSSLHAELWLEPNGIFVRNLGSRNGIHAGGARIQEGLVDIETQLLLGRTVIRLEALEEQAEVPFSPVRRTGGLVGSTLKMKIVFGLLRQYAQVDAPVLIEGETGTGKELAARAIHDLSGRATGPYEILDCGAIPDRLIEAELFGVNKGAYTGATASRPGIFERAAGGTVVLDEIGELPLELQPTLLGVLERGQVRRLGDDCVRRVSCRVIATTNRILAREVASGRFRQDLYFRLGVLRVTIPTLRDRKEDIALLVDEFLGPRHGFPPSWMRVLADHDWPGNVRELRNTLVRAQSHARRHGTDGPLELVLGGEEQAVENIETARRRFEQVYLRALLAKTGHNVAKAARLAGVTRQGLYRLLHRNGLGPKRNREEGEEHSIDDEEEKDENLSEV